MQTLGKALFWGIGGLTLLIVLVVVFGRRPESPQQASVPVEGPRMARLKAVGFDALVPVPTDAGCYDDLVKTARLTGVEIRKKLIELAETGCMYSVPVGTRVLATRRDASSYLVTIREGREKNRTGIVPIAWLNQFEQPY
ncbi:MAG TPA: hypothetical protein VNH41_10355 [Steroidobacteraceae bacterium]|nr:hypothetical protein [Steroidobacteraceae bacterium]